jgi:hypothetical protein
LKSHVGRKFLFAHTKGAGVFTEDVDAFVSLCNGMVDTDIPQIVLPHPGWQAPLLDRAGLKMQFGWSAYSCVIGTNGFITPTRQYVEVVSRLIEFAVEQNVLIFVACPRHSSHDRHPEHVRQEKLLRCISREYPKNLQLEREYLDQGILNLRLQACDLLWCWTSGASSPYGSGTCSDQYASGTRLVVTDKQQHSQVLGLPNIVLGSTDLEKFVTELKYEVLDRNFARHDPSSLSWETFSIALRDFLMSVPKVAPKVIASQNNTATCNSCEDICESISEGYSVPRKLSIDHADEAAEAYIRSIGPYPNSFAGRGIVVCAGGLTYNTCAWVLIRLLRSLGCQLPIEVWSYESEFDSEWVQLIERYQVVVRFVDSPSLRRPTRQDGWKLKSKAILQSSFREVLLLDADNVPVRDPSYLFDSIEYQMSGAVFWPDCGRTNPNSDQWKVFGVPYRDEPEQESGQILINKEVAWKPINLCAWYNENASFFYRYIYGDKDTFRFAWHRCKVKFAMPLKGVRFGLHTMLQHDFEGKLVFQHRFGDKWSLKRNRVSPGFIHEGTCLQFIEELRQLWLPENRARTLNQLEPAANLEIENCTFRCSLMGHSTWTMRLEPLGLVEIGRTSDIEGWWVRHGQLVLGTIDGSPNYSLDRKLDGSWLGSGPDRTQLKLTIQDGRSNEDDFGASRE